MSEECSFATFSASLPVSYYLRWGLKALNNPTAFAAATPEGPDDQLCAAAPFSARSKFRVI